MKNQLLEKAYKSTRQINTTKAPVDWRLSIAPMMDWTDRHCRYFLRLMSKHIRLYTEMLSTQALIHGDTDKLLGHCSTEHPLALQLGGCNPKEMAICSQMAEDWGYQEVNINAGCPSSRVQQGRFGACLLNEPNLVAECINNMQQRCALPITVKTRIGLDEQDSFDFLHRFIERVSQAGCQLFILHARKAWLQGLSPKENREIPPLDYNRVYAIKQAFPKFTIVLNGGICSLSQVKNHCQKVDGVMLGRAAYHNPFLLSQVDQQLFGVATPEKSRLEIVENMISYLQNQCKQGIPLKAMTRHMMGLFQAQPGARTWRRFLSNDPNLTPRRLLNLAQTLTARAKQHVASCSL